MRVISENVRKGSRDAGGRDIWTYTQRFVVEDADVGQTRPHFGGHHYRRHTFTQADVGKVIEVQADRADRSGWQCWGFVA